MFIDYNANIENKADVNCLKIEIDDHEKRKINIFTMEITE